ncbi:MAG: hypothetical protein H6Q35_398 [Proteobacteria bacterium]|nr:hypothetical protein [Pseudomonadota bacterium]
MIDIINFGMTASLPANYVLDIGFTLLVKAVLPVYLVRKAIEKYFR